MHFERSAVQTFFEQRLGCTDHEQFGAYAEAFAELRLTLSDSNSLSESVEKDIKGQFERSVLTLLQALVDLNNKNYLWAAVKLYYSIFYALRVELSLNGISMVRCSGVYTTSGQPGTRVARFNTRRERGDHGIAIALASRHLADSDILQGAKIDELSTYNWMKRLREIVQYKMRRPPELMDFDPFFPADQMDVADQVSMFLADNEPYFCFDPDYAALAIPIKRLQLTAVKVKSDGIPLSGDFRIALRALTERSGAGKLLRPLF